MRCRQKKYRLSSSCMVGSKQTNISVPVSSLYCGLSEKCTFVSLLSEPKKSDCS